MFLNILNSGIFCKDFRRQLLVTLSGTWILYMTKKDNCLLHNKYKISNSKAFYVWVLFMIVFRGNSKLQLQDDLN